MRAGQGEITASVAPNPVVVDEIVRLLAEQADQLGEPLRPAYAEMLAALAVDPDQIQNQVRK